MTLVRLRMESEPRFLSLRERPGSQSARRSPRRLFGGSRGPGPSRSAGDGRPDEVTIEAIRRLKAIAVAKIILQIDPANDTAQEQVLALNTQRGIPTPPPSRRSACRSRRASC